MHRKTKPNQCTKCGCERQVLVRAEAHFQADRLKIKYKWLCFNCLLKAVDLLSDGINTYDYRKAMSVMSDRGHRD